MTTNMRTLPGSASITRRWTRLLLGVLAVPLSALWFGALARRPLFDPDEGRYAEIPREMLASGDWVVPHLNGLVYLEKPPLQYWLTALAFRVFGQTEFAARLTTGLAGYFSLALVCYIGYRLWGIRAGLKALGLAAASVLFVLLGHQMTLDMLLCLCLTASLACFLMAELEGASGNRSHARAWMLGCWAAMAFSVLTKGLIGVLIPAATFMAYALWQRDFSGLRRLYLRWGIPLFSVIAVPWFAMAARANSKFLEFFFIREHFQRYLTKIEHRTEPWWFFGPVLAIGILPWFPQAVRAVGMSFRRSARAFDPTRILCAWCVFVLVFFSLSNAKLIPYILPAVPALALLCAAPSVGHTRRDLLIGALLSFASFLGILVYASGVLNSGRGQDLAIQLAPVLLGTAALLALAGLICLLLARQNRLDAALATLCCGWFLASVSLIEGANTAQRFFSSKDAAEILLSNAGAASPIFSVQTYEQAMTFYLRRDVVLVDYQDEFEFGLRENPQRGIASLDEFANRWRALGDAYAIMPYYTRDHLLARGLPLHEIARFPSTVLVRRRPVT